MSRISRRKVRSLTLTDLGLRDDVPEEDIGQSSLSIDKSELSETDTILQQTRRALEMNYAGVILSGSPGTGKSWYAQQIAVELTGDWGAVRSVQFHPSYQYEDFVFGYMPLPQGGFAIQPKEFALVCREAAGHPERTYALIIDELSRSDVIRVFGEALTYLEVDKRDRAFGTACGEELIVPRNLVLIATMNPWDKGVDELDVALERRFAQIDLPPSGDTLLRLLIAKGAAAAFAEKMVSFFNSLQRLDNDLVRIGHAYFLTCVDKASASDTWSFRLRPTFSRACRLDKATYAQIEELWQAALEQGAVQADETAEAA